MKSSHVLGTWTYSNRVSLLENGEEYFPAVNAAIDEARDEVLIETFILFDDKVGQELRTCLINAARRGVRVTMTVDGYGSPDLPAEFVGGMTAVGIDFRYFDPRPRLFGMRTNAFRRLHRKIVVIDRRQAFIGGINYSEEHLYSFGPKAKQDYAVVVSGPVVAHMHMLVHATLHGQKAPRSRPWWRTRVIDSKRTLQDGAPATLMVWRDNDHHRDDIELHYRMAIRSARRDVLIANAYFFPGYRLVRELRRAARRGVRVRLVLQGTPDQPVATWAARSLYTLLMRAGVEIYEYCERPLHGKVAVIDERWSTVGSSNLDPSSLSLNLEANLIFDDEVFTAKLRERLHHLIQHSCQRVDPARPPAQPLWRQIAGYVVFHIMRWVPTWDRWLPRRNQPVIAATSAEARRLLDPAITDTSKRPANNDTAESRCA